ncbi:hypothetical protein Ahia01_000700300, partial [Argonauta hians]
HQSCYTNVFVNYVVFSVFLLPIDMITDNVERKGDDVVINSGPNLAPEPKRGVVKGGGSYKTGVSRVARLVSKNLFKCDDCGKNFSRKEYLQIHQKSHLTENPFTCKVCGKVFDRNFPLKKHEKVHERDNKKKKLKKVELAKRDESSDDSRKTTMVGSGEGNESSDNDGNLSCHVCGKVYEKLVSMKRHETLHKKKPFSCSICKRNFVLDAELQLHITK